MDDKISMSLDEIIRAQKSKNKKNETRNETRKPHTFNRKFKTNKKQTQELQTRKFINKGRNPIWSKPTTVLADNLHFKVTGQDLKELFGEFGPIKSVKMHFDQFRRPNGSANILFERKDDAARAVKQYDRVPLDGRPMRLSIKMKQHPQVGRPERLQSHQKSRDSVQNEHNQRFSMKNNKEQRRPVGQKNNTRFQKSKKPTIEDLDAEMEEYNRMRASNVETNLIEK